IVLKRATTFTIKIQDPDGKPIAAAHAAGTTSRNWMYPTECDGDSCVVYGLDRKTPRLVAICDDKHTVAGTVTITGAEKEPVVAKLTQFGTVKGVLIDHAGKPVANVAVFLGYGDRAVEEIDRFI